jgi:aminoglycoside 2''-phosphotransferase
MGRISRYLSHIQVLYPDLAIEKASLNEEGQFNDGLIVNEEVIFRFPKNSQALEMMHIEYEILRNIQGCTDLAVPNPIISHMETDVLGEAFIGYRLIPGKPFWRETFLSLQEEEIMQRVVSQIATFLKQLHGIPATKLIQAPLPRRESREEWTDLFIRFRTKLFPHLNDSEQVRVTNNFARFLADSDNFAYQPVLRHGDFGTVNLLYEPVKKTLSGVIDFGNAGLGDPALDIAYLIAPFGYGEKIIDRLAVDYPLDDDLLARARFYVSTFALQEALYGIEYDNTRAFNLGLAGYHPPAARW